MKYYLIAGEASGDVHASKLMKGLITGDPEAEFRCWGGENMEAAGGTIVKHYRDLAYMGFQEVVLNLRKILGNIRFCKQDILTWKPDVVILIDYPGFNMRIAEFAKKNGFKVFYYIAPQVWAWKKRRVHKLHKNNDLTFVVMPFEKDFHARYGYKAEFTGHPMPDSLDLDDKIDDKKFRASNGLNDKPIIALVPGSRKQELQRILPHMLKASIYFPDYQFVIAGVKTIQPELYQKITEKYPVRIVFNQTYDLLKTARAAAVKSGTVTLETAMLNVPEVVCYRFSLLSALLAGIFVHVKFISLVNIILDRKAVAELIQFKFTAETLKKELKLILPDGENRTRILSDYTELRALVGQPGASERAARVMIEHLKSNNK